MANPMIVFDSIANSNLPRYKKSQIAHMFDRLTNGRASDLLEGIGGHHMASGIEAIRRTSEGAATGALLGAIQATIGLDAKFKGFKLPLDAVLWGMFTGAGIKMAGRSLAEDSLTIGSNCMAIFSFRKTGELLGMKSGVSKMAGEFGEDSSDSYGVDPIIEAAKNLQG